MRWHQKMSTRWQVQKVFQLKRLALDPTVDELHFDEIDFFLFTPRADEPSDGYPDSDEINFRKVGQKGCEVVDQMGFMITL